MTALTTLPIVKNEAGGAVPAQPVILVDTAGAYASGGGGGGDASAANQVITNTELGSVTETAPASDTASSGLNGRLQRVAQRLTSLIALLPTALGQTTKSASLPVTLASDQGEVGKVYTGIFNVQGGTLTRPTNTTAYVTNDSISDNATAGSVTANSVTLSDTNDLPIEIAEILLDSTDTGPGVGAIQIRLHAFNSDPTANSGVGAGDNAAWSNKRAGWLGSFTGTMRAFSDGSRGVLVPDEGALRICNPVSGAKTIYWQLQALGGFTPSANSTTFTPRFKGFQGRIA
jgi:hypothetical protein